MDREHLVWADLSDAYDLFDANSSYERLYSEEDDRLKGIFKSFHQRLDESFNFMNEKKRVNGHFNADDSRRLIALIAEIKEVRGRLRSIGVDLVIRDTYQNAINRCEEFLTSSGGSAIPEDFGPVLTDRYTSAFTSQEQVIRRDSFKPSLVFVGEGSYALVHKYLDPFYGVYYARKKAKRGIGDQDLARFKEEFKVLRGLSHPNVIQVYAYDDTNDSYTMEYCETTLDEHIWRRNERISAATRKRIALQFLYGVGYLHWKRLLHRDLSKRNILVKEHESSVVTVKISDLGLHKKPESVLTHTDSSMKGTIVDPTLDRFGDFDVLAEIYAIGHVLSYIFTGKAHLTTGAGDHAEIIRKCVDSDRSARFDRVTDIIEAVDRL